MRRALTCVGAAVIAIGVLGGCSDDDGGDAAPPTTVSPSATNVLAGASTSSTAAPTSTTLPDGTAAGACPALPALPANARDVSRDIGDFDGDKVLDTLVAYHASGQTWRLRVGLTTGGGAELELPGVTGDSMVTTLGGANLGGNAGAEAFAVIGQGAATTSVAVFALQGCTLARVLDAAGQPAEFPIGGTVLNGSGLRCDEVGGEIRLSVLRATSSDGLAFATTSQPFVLQGDRFVASGTPSQGSLIAPADDGRLGEFFRISCGGVAEPS